MSANLTDAILIARRYAAAIFAQALEAKKESLVVDQFQTLADAIDANDALRRALANPLVSRAQKTAVVSKLMQSAEDLTQRCVAVVANAGRAELIPTIARLLVAQLSAHRGERSAIVTSARVLSTSVQEQLKASLARATGKQTTVAFAQNPDLLGGIVVELGSLRLDASLAGALTHMRAELSAPIAS